MQTFDFACNCPKRFKFSLPNQPSMFWFLRYDGQLYLSSYKISALYKQVIHCHNFHFITKPPIKSFVSTRMHVVYSLLF